MPLGLGGGGRSGGLLLAAGDAGVIFAGKLVLELLDAAGRVEELQLTGEKRVASIADIDGQLGDRAAGAIKSGGTTRRAAKMVVVDVDQPEHPMLTPIEGLPRVSLVLAD